jgi:hypothetical protein
MNLFSKFQNKIMKFQVLYFRVFTISERNHRNFAILLYIQKCRLDFLRFKAV